MRLFSRRCAALALLAVLGVPARASAEAVPVHGALLTSANDRAVVRIDAVTGMLPAQTRAVQLTPTITAPSGTGIDGFLDRAHRPWRLYDAAVAARFVPGLPESGKVFPIDYGSALPRTRLVDQHGKFVDLATDFRGKVLVLTFIFTRCPDKDECPALSAKFAALQRRIDPSRVHLIEMTLDPAYDSPWVIRRYAQQFGADASAWSIVTGQQHEVQHLLDRFGISSLPEGDANFIHNDKVFLTTPDGKVADIVQTTGFTADALNAQIAHLAGMASSPIGRFRLAMVASAIALCGGSQFAGVVLLETVAFLIIAIASFLTLGWVARKIWRRA